MQICNNRLLMKKYQEHLIKVDRSIFNGVLLGRRKIQLRLSLEDDLKNLILNLQNVYYLLNSFCNLVNLGFFNNNGYYHDNEYKNLY